jgi:carotenoid cleavage dioxygenase-like enzyme
MPTSNTNQTAWARAVLPPGVEFPPTELTVLSGSIPPGIRGSLYRNGPARLQRGKRRVGHWFDGDGAVLGVRFTSDKAIGTYRFVQTAGYRHEEQAETLLYGGYGMLPPGSWWNRWRYPVKNVANTSVLALPDKVLALWEGGHPHALDPQTLETRGTDDLDGLAAEAPFSAHPKRDPQTGEIYNFGVVFGRQPSLNLYRCNAMGKIVKQNAIPLSGMSLIHDFVLAGRYLVFCIPPVRLKVLPVLLKFMTFSQAMSWQPSLGTEILVVDRETLQETCRLQAEPWYQWHFGNGCEDEGGNIVLDMVRYEDFQTNRYLQEVATGNPKTKARGNLWQLRLSVQKGKVIELTPLYDRTCEFPCVVSSQVSQPWRFTYLSVLRNEEDLGKELVGGAIARVDRGEGKSVTVALPAGDYTSEPICIPDRDREEQMWLLVVVYRSSCHTSELWILDANRFDGHPVCRLQLPRVIPIGFHGTWQAD